MLTDSLQEYGVSKTEHSKIKPLTMFLAKNLYQLNLTERKKQDGEKLHNEMRNFTILIN
jgi:hypothetical protein